MSTGLFLDVPDMMGRLLISDVQRIAPHSPPQLGGSEHERIGSLFVGIGIRMLTSGVHECLGRRGRRTNNTCIEDCRLVRKTVAVFRVPLTRLTKKAALTNLSFCILYQRYNVEDILLQSFV
jgi:hypothetical protein